MHPQEDLAGGDPDQLGPLLQHWPAVVNRMLTWMEDVKCNADGLGSRPIDILGHNEKWRAARASGPLRTLVLFAGKARRMVLAMGANDGPTTRLLDLLDEREMPDPATIASAADAVQRQLTHKRVASKPLAVPQPAPPKIAIERGRPSMEVIQGMVPQVLHAFRALRDGTGEPLSLGAITASEDPRAKAIRWGKLHLESVADALFGIDVPAFKMDMFRKSVQATSATAGLHALCALACGRSIGAVVTNESTEQMAASRALLSSQIQEGDLVRLEKQVELEMRLLRELEAGMSPGDGIVATKSDAISVEETAVASRKPLDVLYALRDLLVDVSRKDERAGADAHALIFGDGNLHADLVSIAKQRDDYAQMFGGSPQPTIKWAPCNGHHALAWWCEMLANLTNVRSETIPRVRGDLDDARKRGDQVLALECEGSVRKAEVYFATEVADALAPLLKDYDWVHQSLRKEIAGQARQSRRSSRTPAKQLTVGGRPSVEAIDATATQVLREALEAAKAAGTAYVPDRAAIAKAVSKQLGFIIEVSSLFATKAGPSGREHRYPNLIKLWKQVQDASKVARRKRTGWA